MIVRSKPSMARVKKLNDTSRRVHEVLQPQRLGFFCPCQRAQLSGDGEKTRRTRTTVRSGGDDLSIRRTALRSPYGNGGEKDAGVKTDWRFTCHATGQQAACRLERQGAAASRLLPAMIENLQTSENPAVSHAAALWIADPDTPSDVKRYANVQLPNRSPMLARLAGYSALHAKAEEFDLWGHSPLLDSHDLPA